MVSLYVFGSIFWLFKARARPSTLGKCISNSYYVSKTSASMDWNYKKQAQQCNTVNVCLFTFYLFSSSTRFLGIYTTVLYMGTFSLELKSEVIACRLLIKLLYWYYVVPVCIYFIHLLQRDWAGEYTGLPGELMASFFLGRKIKIHLGYSYICPTCRSRPAPRPPDRPADLSAFPAPRKVPPPPAAVRLAPVERATLSAPQGAGSPTAAPRCGPSSRTQGGANYCCPSLGRRWGCTRPDSWGYGAGCLREAAAAPAALPADQLAPWVDE